MLTNSFALTLNNSTGNFEQSEAAMKALAYISERRKKESFEYSTNTIDSRNQIHLIW